MRAYSSHQYVLPLPPGHRFPMAKYARLHARVAAAADALGIELVDAPRAPWSDVSRAHTPAYLEALRTGALDPRTLRRIGFPWSPAMLERTLRSSGATAAGLEHAIRTGGCAVNLAGGTHHAHADGGAGYCVLNDSIVAIRRAQALGLARTVLVVDLDVHQGDGTARIADGDPSIYTLSVHGARNYPAAKARSDLDVALPDGTEDADYLAALDAALDRALEESGADSAIYLAGADPYAGDRLGHLALSRAGLAERDRRVLARLREAGLPLVVTMGGGYAESVDEIVDIHFATIAAAAALDRLKPWGPAAHPIQHASRDRPDPDARDRRE